jgi:hypothetical protein
MLADQHGLVVLIEHLDLLGHDPALGPLRVIALVDDCGGDANGIADEDRPDEAQPIIAIRHRAHIDRPGGHADRYAEDQRAVRDALAEILGFTPLGVHMVWEEVAGLSGMYHDVGLGDRAAERLAGEADGVIFEELFLEHGLNAPTDPALFAILCYSISLLVKEKAR